MTDLTYMSFSERPVVYVHDLRHFLPCWLELPQYEVPTVRTKHLIKYCHVHLLPLEQKKRLFRYEQR